MGDSILSDIGVQHACAAAAGAKPCVSSIGRHVVGPRFKSQEGWGSYISRELRFLNHGDSRTRSL